MEKSYEPINIFKADVKDLNDLEKKDVVISYHLQVTAKEGDKFAVLNIGVDLNVEDLSGHFIPIEELSKNDLIKWGLDSLTEQKKNLMDRILKNKLEHFQEEKKKPIIINKEKFEIK